MVAETSWRADRGNRSRAQRVCSFLKQSRHADCLRIDVKLIQNNAHVGAQVASEVARLDRGSRRSTASSSNHVSAHAGTQSSPKIPPLVDVKPAAKPAFPPSVLVFGSAAIDITSSTSTALSPRSTTPGSIFVSPGGVGRNIAEAAQNLLPPQSVQLVSIIGRHTDSSDRNEADELGKLLIAEMERAGLRNDGLVLSPSDNSSTAACSLMLEKEGDLAAGVADMAIVENLTGDMVRVLSINHQAAANTVRSRHQ